MHCEQNKWVSQSILFSFKYSGCLYNFNDVKPYDNNDADDNTDNHDD